MPAALSLNN